MKAKDLLIVLGILALFVLLLFPKFSSIRTKDRKKRVHAEIQSINIAIIQYEAQYGLKPFGEEKAGDSLIDDKGQKDDKCSWK